ncbi:MAG: CO dehydrogenase/acetyl-CoA synthase complex subunit epsilon [ANME-2 cluster archaeon]|nr:CO dehydrogenase/acetyl-CoA synthase complex subunit epsilon [ANME-2 cluster archaeon]
MAAKVLDTTRNAVPFDRANVPGPKMAKAVQAEMAGKLISKAKRPLLIIGSAISEEGIVDVIKSMAEKGIPVAATGSSLKRLKDEGIEASYVNLHALVSYLKDPNWKGFDGNGGYDTAIFLGHTYYYASQLMSTLKNFTKIKIISIDRHYHPNAQQSFGNLKPEDFIRALDVVIAQL